MTRVTSIIDDETRPRPGSSQIDGRYGSSLTAADMTAAMSSRLAVAGGQTYTPGKPPSKFSTSIGSQSKSAGWRLRWGFPSGTPTWSNSLTSSERRTIRLGCCCQGLRSEGQLGHLDIADRAAIGSIAYMGLASVGLARGASSVVVLRGTKSSPDSKR
jgi:hypothetical protein